MLSVAIACMAISASPAAAQSKFMFDDYMRQKAAAPPPQPSAPVPAPAPSVAQPPNLPELVLARQAEVRKDCDDQVQFKPGFIKTANISADGKTDYILDYGELVCKGFRSMYCGSGGCNIDFIVSEGGTYLRDSRLLQSYRLIDAPGGAVIMTSMHGTSCNRIGAEICEGVLMWRRGKLTNQN